MDARADRVGLLVAGLGHPAGGGGSSCSEEAWIGVSFAYKAQPC